MAYAAWTVRRAEARKRRRKARERGVERTFVASGRDEDALDRPCLRQLVDMPMDFLVAPHVPGNSRLQPAWTTRGAAVKIKSRR